MTRRVALGAALALVACTLVLGACGEDENGGGAAAPGTEETGSTEGAKAIDPASMEGATGEITYCTGKDTTGAKAESVKIFNREFESEGLSLELVEFPTSADEQRNQFTQRQRAKAPDCDIFYSDVIWTAEFASQKWLYDLTPYVQERKDEFIPSTLETALYDGKYWGVPKNTNAGFLFYRTDQVDDVPATWQGVYEDAKEKNGIVYQGASYEGLTVDFLELAYAAGGEILSEDGSEAVIDSPENLAALEFMVNGVKDGTAPEAVVTFMEEESRRAFEGGRATYMRNWPYAYGLGNLEGSDIKGKFDVVPYPPFEGGGTAGILGGANFVISAYSQNPGGALKAIDFLTSEESDKRDAARFSDPPVLSVTYDDPEVKEALPFAAELKQAVEQARPRPVSPVYTQISQAIYENVNAALTGSMAPQEALSAAQADIEQALATF